MKLMCEYLDGGIDMLTEANEKGEKSYFIEGVFAQADKQNRNGRRYPQPVMEGAINKYITEQVSKGRAVGELNHPAGPTINLDKVSHKITSLKFEGNDVIGKAQILDTPMGKIVKNLMDGGVQLGVSTRGMGSLEQKNGVMEVKNDFHLATVDIVQDPSAPDAFVNGIMEGVEWEWNNGVIQAKDVEAARQEIVESVREFIPEHQIKEFKDFLNGLKR